MFELGNERFEAEGAVFIRNRAIPALHDANHVARVTAATPEAIERLLARVEREFAGLPHRRFDVDADTPTGRFVHWRKIRVEGEQPFQVKTNQVETQNLPGIFELWIHDADDYVVLIGWRTPSSIEGPSVGSGGDAVAPKSRFEGPPKDAKLDLSEWPTATAGTLTVKKAGGN